MGLADAVEQMLTRIERLESRVKELEGKFAQPTANINADAYGYAVNEPAEYSAYPFGLRR